MIIAAGKLIRQANEWTNEYQFVIKIEKISSATFGIDRAGSQGISLGSLELRRTGSLGFNAKKWASKVQCQSFVLAES